MAEEQTFVTSPQGDFRVQRRRVVGFHLSRWICALFIAVGLVGAGYFVACRLDRAFDRAAIIDSEDRSTFLNTLDDTASTLNYSSRNGSEISREKTEISRLHVPAELMPPFLKYLDPDDPDFSELNRRCLKESYGKTAGPGKGGIRTCSPIRFSVPMSVYTLIDKWDTEACADGPNTSWFSFNVNMSTKQYYNAAAICLEWPNGDPDAKTQLGTCGVEANMVGIVGQGWPVDCKVPPSGQTPPPDDLQLIGGPWCDSCTVCALDPVDIAKSSCYPSARRLGSTDTWSPPVVGGAP
ncbi:unnamed protein product [Prorocentrum cordatum]|uniref:Uncharacterized protein n=1 Tax=Prorocentrum cordatum TaxID=2364126 RepID=A0ABN9WPK1_9DINO|nr:unnamed protein product [Polarella glacialis]